jgi:hypothetical protein
MFQALIFQERDARGDLKAHKQVQAPPVVIAEPEHPKIEVNLVKHPTRANLIGGKGLFVDMHREQWGRLMGSDLYSLSAIPAGLSESPMPKVKIMTAYEEFWRWSYLSAVPPVILVECMTSISYSVLYSIIWFTIFNSSLWTWINVAFCWIKLSNSIALDGWLYCRSRRMVKGLNFGH